MKSGFGLLGVPSSAAAHGPGQERAPAALRRAGLPARLAAFRDRGIEPALLSMDGGVDLFIPATNPPGSSTPWPWRTCWTSPGPL
jgi:arginase family enzyme